MPFFAAPAIVSGIGAAGAAGGGSKFAAASTAGSGLFGSSLISTVSTGLSLASTVASGISRSKQLESQARIEEFNAGNREIERKKELIRALAIQNVKGGASGTQMDGSRANLLDQEISEASYDQFKDDAATRMTASALKSDAKSAKQFSLLSAGGDAVSFAKRGSARGTA